MRKIIVGIALSAYACVVVAQSSDCSNIKQDINRLACYDKSAFAIGKNSTEQAPVSPPLSTEAQKLPEGVVFKSSSWYIHQEPDSMTDKKNCTALYKNKWTVQGTPDSLYISLKGRGGVKSYMMRLDDSPPDEVQFASEIEKRIDAVNIQSNFHRIYISSRLRLRIFTILDDIIVEDIDLNGFAEAVDFIRTKCGN